jgi:hypothetical protein
MALANYILTADVQASWPAAWSELANGPSTGVVTAPAVPASTVAAFNLSSEPVQAALTGGTVTVVAVNGATVATSSPVTVTVPAGGYITLTYSVAPTWVWTPLSPGPSASGAGEAVLVSPVPGPGGQAGAVPLMFWRKGMMIMIDIATANGLALQTAIGAGNLRAAVPGDLVGREGTAN